MAWLFLFVVLFSAEVSAEPQFYSEDEAFQKIATRAWTHAIRCTGWEAPAHDRIEIRINYVEGSYDSAAWLDDEGLYRIDLGPENPKRDLLHELSHAWARKGPATLTEGRADLLADCIAQAQPEAPWLDPDPGGALTEMPDLRKWENARRGSDSPHVQGHAYLAAARFMRVIATTLPPEEIWPQTGQLKWRQLTRSLENAGPAGVTILSVLESGVSRQRMALSDEDQDGMPWLAEVLQGTQPDRWDSDGDGWWDGAPPPPVAAVPLPPDGTPVCSGFAAGEHGAMVNMMYQGQWRGTTRPPVQVIAGDTLIQDDPAKGVWVPPNQPVLMILEGKQHHSSGGIWAMVGGQGLVLDWNCRSTPKYTLWVRDPLAVPLLDSFEQALIEHLKRADGLLGTPHQRIVVHLGAPSLQVNPEVVQLPTSLLRWAAEQERADIGAALAVSLHRVWQAGQPQRRWDTVEAITRAILDNPPEPLFVSVDRWATENRRLRAVQCPTGWKGLLTGNCDTPERETASKP